MKASAKKKEERPSDDEILRQILEARDDMVFLLKKGYSDIYNRHKIEQMREVLQSYRNEYPEIWAHAEQISKTERS